MEDAEILCQIRGKAPVWADAVLDVFGAVGRSHWSERVVNYLHLQYLLISLITSLGVEKRWKEKSGEKNNGIL